MPQPAEAASTPARNRAVRTLLPLLGLTAIAYLGLYLYCSHFGLYEDDYYFTIGPYLWHWRTFVDYLQDAWHSWPQFRPLGFSITYIITYSTAQFDSLAPAYGLGLLLNAVNGYLLYLIARRIVRTWVAFAAGCVFLLYPSDTSKAILMLRGFELVNLTLVLSAILLYVKGRRIPAYVVACACLLIYEHFFLPFLIAPFLLTDNERFSFRRLASHWTLCALLPASLIVARKFAGDVRSNGVIGSPLEALHRMVTACLIGPKTALLALIERPYDALLHSSPFQWCMIAVTAAIVLAIGLAYRRGEDGASPHANALASAIVGGLLCFAIGYVIAILPDNYPPVVNVGRLSGFNAPASVSACILFAALAEWVLSRSRLLEKPMVFVVSLYIGLLVSTGIQVQMTDYVASWRAQRNFWTTVMATSGEWRPGVAIMVDLTGAPNRSFDTIGFPKNWMVFDALMGTQDLVAPSVWQAWEVQTKSGAAPTVFGFWRGVRWQRKGDKVLLDTPPGFSADRQPLVSDGSFLLFGFRNGALTRLESPLELDGLRLQPIQTPRQEPPPQPVSRLYRILFSKPMPDSELNAKPWPSLLRAKSYPQ